MRKRKKKTFILRKKKEMEGGKRRKKIIKGGKRGKWRGKGETTAEAKKPQRRERKRWMTWQNGIGGKIKKGGCFGM